MPITIRELADAAGVSIATVSRVLNHKDHPVSDETRQRIFLLADEMGYRPNLAARSLRTDRSSTIGVITDNSYSPHVTIIVRGIQDYLHTEGYICMVVALDWDPQVELATIHDLFSRSIDGIIFAETWRQTAVEQLDLSNKPYVFVHRQFPTAHVNSVTPDEIYGARTAVNHLIQLGHRRIGFINGPAHFYASTDRLRGYQDELLANGIAFDPALVASGDWELASGYIGMQKLLQVSPRLTGVFAGNDLMATGAIYACIDAGLAVPGDVAVVGYDNREIASILRPQLTTVTLPLQEMGQEAARMLLQMIRHARPKSPPVQSGMDSSAAGSELKVRGQLIVRASCGAKPLPYPGG